MMDAMQELARTTTSAEMAALPQNQGSSRVLIAMSGGVDSSVAALLMREAGFACTGVTMRLFANEDMAEVTSNLDPPVHERSCCSLADVAFARSVAAQLDFPFYVFDLSTDFSAQVIERFIAGYERGETPNPCIDCNRYLKFERLMARAATLGFDLLATGHYARVGFDAASGRYLLRCGVDADKDQSYALYTLTQAQLARLRLPLGDLRKTEVRELAETAQLPNAQKPDSQNICFVPDGDYARFIEHYRHCSYPPGDLLDVQGRVVGQHAGIIRYTLGQRKGLGSHGHPVYVRALDLKANTVTIGSDDVLYARRFYVRNPNWITLSASPETPLCCLVKIGYRHPARPAVIETVTPIERAGSDQAGTQPWLKQARPGAATSAAAVRLQVTFDKPQRAITPGQAAVFYDGDLVLGGGTIDMVGDTPSKGQF
jgi:tRNA-specific 2-thiouridylase